MIDCREGVPVSRPTRQVNTSAVKHRRAYISISTSGVRDKAAKVLEASSARILDVGCGNGLFFAQVMLGGESKARRFGIDHSLESLLEAKEVFRTNRLAACPLIRGDAFHLPFRTGTFDQVFSLNVIINRPNFGEVEAIIDEMIRVCAPDGSIVFDLRNAHNPAMRLKCWRRNRKGGFQTNAHRLRQFTELLGRKGCEIVRKQTVGPPGRFLALAYVIEARRSPC